MKCSWCCGFSSCCPRLPLRRARLCFLYTRGVKLIFTGRHTSPVPAPKGPNVKMAFGPLKASTRPMWPPMKDFKTPTLPLAQGMHDKASEPGWLLFPWSPTPVRGHARSAAGTAASRGPSAPAKPRAGVHPAAPAPLCRLCPQPGSVATGRSCWVNPVTRRNFSGLPTP